MRGSGGGFTCIAKVMSRQSYAVQCIKRVIGCITRTFWWYIYHPHKDAIITIIVFNVHHITPSDLPFIISIRSANSIFRLHLSCEQTFFDSAVEFITQYVWLIKLCNFVSETHTNSLSWTNSSKSGYFNLLFNPPTFNKDIFKVGSAGAGGRVVLPNCPESASRSVSRPLQL